MMSLDYHYRDTFKCLNYNHIIPERLQSSREIDYNESNLPTSTKLRGRYPNFTRGPD